MEFYMASGSKSNQSIDWVPLHILTHIHMCVYNVYMYVYGKTVALVTIWEQLQFCLVVCSYLEGKKRKNRITNDVGCWQTVSGYDPLNRVLVETMKDREWGIRRPKNVIWKVPGTNLL